MSKDYLDPKQPIGIEPAADRNVEAVGPCCLDVNLKSAYIMKGRGGGAWWMIWMAIAFGTPGIFLGLSIGEPLTGFFYFLFVGSGWITLNPVVNHARVAPWKGSRQVAVFVPSGNANPRISCAIRSAVARLCWSELMVTRIVT